MHILYEVTLFMLSLSLSLLGHTERLKFTPTPRSLQCQELDKEGSLQCSAKGRLPPTVRWTKAGVYLQVEERDKIFCVVIALQGPL